MLIRKLGQRNWIDNRWVDFFFLSFFLIFFFSWQQYSISKLRQAIGYADGNYHICYNRLHSSHMLIDELRGILRSSDSPFGD